MSSNFSVSKFGAISLTSPCCFLSQIVIFTLTIFCGSILATAQRIAVLAPDKTARSQNVRELLEKKLSGKFRLIDDSLAETVPLNSTDQNIFNLSTEDAQNFGSALGGNFFVLVKAATLRRATLSKPDFYIESYAVVYLVSARTGRLALWKLLSFRSPTADESEKQLAVSLDSLGGEISDRIMSANKEEISQENSPEPIELPNENSPEAKSFRVPLPFRRLKPEYTTTANFYSVTATVDAAVDLDENGAVERVTIERWAGYGLDESVEAAIRKMQWRAAEKDGKALPIRVLLRYNFKKIESNDE